MRNIRTAFVFSATLLSCLAAAQGDPAVVAKVIAEGKSRNRVMEHLQFLSENIGARLTGSTSLQRACEWTMSRFKEFGLANCQLEKWGEIPVGFDRGRRQVGRIVSPEVRNFEFTTRSWTPGTNGLVRGRAVLEPADMDGFNRVRSLLNGAWVVMRTRQRGQQEGDAAKQVTDALNAAGIAGRVHGARGELVITSGSFRNLTMETVPKDVNVTVRASDRQAIIDMVAAGKDVVLEFDLEQKMVPGPIPVYNVIAEIRGTEKPDEVVIVGGHLDSWDGPGSTGTCDNGTGTMVALEAARLLVSSGAKPKRTIRFILFTGEEQGLLGSRAYVEAHKAEMEKVSAVFIDDGGTNYSGGLDCIESMVPMLSKAIEAVNGAFPEMPITLRLVSQMSRGGASDHAPFNAVGTPGFFWTETGRANYTFIHHTQHDTLKYAIPEYLVQSSVAAAITSYNLACADTLLPRQPRG